MTCSSSRQTLTTTLSQTSKMVLTACGSSKMAWQISLTLTISDLNGDLLVSVTAAPQNDVLLLGQAGLALDAGDFIFFP